MLTVTDNVELGNATSLENQGTFRRGVHLAICVIHRATVESRHFLGAGRGQRPKGILKNADHGVPRP